jgi:hypothetical protein
VLLNDIAQNVGARFRAVRVQRYNHAALIDFRDGDPSGAPDTQNAPRPIQLLESSTLLQIHQQVGAKAPGVFFRPGFLGDPGNRLPADQRMGATS